MTEQLELFKECYLCGCETPYSDVVLADAASYCTKVCADASATVQTFRQHEMSGDCLHSSIVEYVQSCLQESGWGRQLVEGWTTSTALADRFNKFLVAKFVAFAYGFSTQTIKDGRTAKVIVEYYSRSTHVKNTVHVYKYVERD